MFPYGQYFSFHVKQIFCLLLRIMIFNYVQSACLERMLTKDMSPSKFWHKHKVVGYRLILPNQMLDMNNGTKSVVVALSLT